MQIVRFRAADRVRWGALEGTSVVEYSGTPYSQFTRGRRRFPLRQVILLAPVTPTKVIAVSLNHPRRAAELGVAMPGEPLVVLKPSTSVIGPDDPIVFPASVPRIEHEAELGVVIKRVCRNVPLVRARDAILGYTAVNDVTARPVREGALGLAKAFDTFCPIGPCVATDLDPNGVRVEALVNGTLRQSSSTKELAIPADDLVAWISRVMTLLPGDVIATGTPPGVGPLEPGDRVEVRVDGVGVLRNPVLRP